MVDELDWRDANFEIHASMMSQTDHFGPENGIWYTVWRLEDPGTDNKHTWTYFTNVDSNGDNLDDRIGYILDNPHPTWLNGDWRFFVTTGWPSNIPFPEAGGKLPEMGTVLTHDYVTGGKHNDMIALGPGNDRIDAGGGADSLYGGDGNDLIYAGTGNDFVAGDYVNAPIVLDEDFKKQVFKWEAPTEADPDVIDGDDELHGEKGSDTLIGGGGNDILDGGPRGDGFLDILTGGAGADIFFLSYDTGGDLDKEQSNWWTDWGEDVVEGAAESAVKIIVKNTAQAAQEALFDGLPGAGIILGGLVGVANVEAQNAISKLFDNSPAVKPPPTTEDVMVVTDFDPREDVLFMPVEEGKTITATATLFASTPVAGLSGWGASFSTLDKVVAEVLLSRAFLEEFDLAGSDAATEAFINNIFSASLVVGSGGTEDTDMVYPFSTNPDDYVDGTVPDSVGEKLALSTPDGVETRIFGAFAPHTVTGPSVTTGELLASGTVMGDIISVNQFAFAPSDYLNRQLTTLPTYVKGFGGSDIILGGAGQDFLFGGGGNDDLYAFQSTVTTDGPLVEELFGGDGNDVLYVGGTAATVDGNNNTDTVSFELSPYSATIDLSFGKASDTGTSSQGVAPNSGNVYTLKNIENVRGSVQADVITGDDGNNVIDGGKGSDTLTGGVGADTFVLASGDGPDTIADFKQGIDLIGLADGLTFDDLTLSDSDILVGGDTLATLTGVDATSLTQNDFVSLAASVAAAPITNGGNGTSGYDTIFGSHEADSLSGNAGDDTLIGHGGNDTINGGSGNDVIDGGDGSDTVHAGPGDDIATGGRGNDILAGGTGDDVLAGALGADKILGHEGNDALWGGLGHDLLFGGPGYDTLRGGPGFDTLQGDDGNDLFVLEAGEGSDVITDFEQGADQIGLAGGLSFSDLSFAGDKIMVGDHRALVTLTGVDTTALSEADFLLV